MSETLSALYELGVLILILLVIYGLFMICRGAAIIINRSRKKKDTKTIRVNKRQLETALFLIIMGAILGVVAVLGRENSSVWWTMFALFMCAIIFGVLLIVYYINRQIILEDDYFVLRNTWRKTCYVPYETIQRFGMEKKWGTRYFVVHTDIKKYRFDWDDMDGIEAFRTKVAFEVGEEKRMPDQVGRWQQS